MKNDLLNQQGLTLVELLVVIVIISIVMSIGVISIDGYENYVEEKVCIENRLIIKRSYELYLFNEKKDHTNLLFEEFLLENNYKPLKSDAVYIYTDGEINCTHHDEEDENDEEVPYL